jgi:hypothetical protein
LYEKIGSCNTVEEIQAYKQKGRNHLETIEKDRFPQLAFHYRESKQKEEKVRQTSR